MAKRTATPRTAKKALPAIETVTAVRNSPLPKAVAAKKEVTCQDIARRAYEIWQTNGGGELDNWLAAERELRG